MYNLLECPHSHLHKKYIFVYTAFTISYNRAVAGTPVWMDDVLLLLSVTHDLRFPPRI